MFNTFTQVFNGHLKKKSQFQPYQAPPTTNKKKNGKLVLPSILRSVKGATIHQFFMPKTKHYPVFLPCSVHQVLVKLSPNISLIQLLPFTFFCCHFALLSITSTTDNNNVFVAVFFGFLRLCFPCSNWNDIFKSSILSSPVINQFITSHCSQNNTKPPIMF